MTATDDTPPAAPERRVVYLRLSEIQRAERNPKRHATDAIGASIAHFGLAELPLLDERTGRIVAGHGRLNDLDAKKTAGDTPPDGVKVDADGDWLVPLVGGWRSRSDDDAASYLVASNRTTELGGWDDAELADLLSNLDAADAELLNLTGYDRDDLGALLESLDPDDDTADPPTAGGALALADVTVGEPRHRAERGDTWHLGHHALIVCDVHTRWNLWAPMLTEGTIFVPYPSPLAALTTRAATTPFVMVQPDPYLAGHVLDKYAAIHGPDSVTRIP